MQWSGAFALQAMWAGS